MSGPLNADAIRAGAAGAGTAAGYSIDQSIRFNDGDSPKLTGGTGQTGDGTQWTISMWVKRGAIDGGNKTIWSAGDGSNKRALSRFVSGGSGQVDEDISFSVRTGGSWYELNVHQSFVDPAAWYHFVWVWDSDNGTAADRMRIYLNGDRLTSFSNTPSYPASATATDSWNNSSYAHQIGFENNTRFFDGYLAEMYHIDGQALTPASFGETNSDTGQWVPIDASGLTFGTRGFYLKGENSSDLGNDSSGNNNDFTSSGLTSADQVTDSPSDNYATLNPLMKHSSVTFADGNLEVACTANGWFGSIGTVGIQLGDKVYFEGKCLTNTRLYFGLSRVNGSGGTIKPESDGGFEGGQSDTDYMWRVTDANTVYYQTTNQSVTVSAVAVNDIVGCSVDTDGTVKFYKNGTEIHSFSTTLVAGDTYMPVYSVNGATSTEKWEVRFGSTGISHQPTGFSLLRTSDMDDPTVADGSEYFHPQTYTGTGSSGNSITNDASAGDFKPDLLWLAPRSNGDHKVLFDSVRTTNKRVKTNSPDPQDTDGTAQLTFETDGFDLDTTDVNFNGLSRTYVAWQWHTTGGTTSSNTDGSITSTVSVNTTAGVSVLTYEGTKANATIGHGLGVAPKMIIIKDVDATESWVVGHDVLGWTKNLFLNLTNSVQTSSTIWNDTAPTSSVFSIGTSDGVNKTQTHMAYCFAEVEGFSKFGGYRGNNSTDGPFVYTGFKPRWVLFRRYNAAEGWSILDTARGSGNFGSDAGSGGTNPTAGNDMNNKINANDSAGEEDNPTGSRRASFLSNGFKLKTTNTAMNSADDYLYMAFAECPFKVATAR